MSDITKLGESKGLIYEVPNYDLQPEKMLNFDVGFTIHSELLKLAFSMYYARIHDLISSSDASYKGSSTILINGDEYIIKSKQNIGQAFIRGIEASLHYPLTEELFISGNVCSAFGHNTTLNEPVGGIPPAFGLLGLKWKRNDCFITVYSRFASKQNRLSADDLDDPRIPVNGTPGWQILSMRTGVNVLAWCRLQVALENIFDVNYREHGSGINGPGRNFIVSIDFGKDRL